MLFKLICSVWLLYWACIHLKQLLNCVYFNGAEFTIWFPKIRSSQLVLYTYILNFYRFSLPPSFWFAEVWVSCLIFVPKIFMNNLPMCYEFTEVERIIFLRADKVSASKLSKINSFFLLLLLSLLFAIHFPRVFLDEWDADFYELN